MTQAKDLISKAARVALRAELRKQVPDLGEEFELMAEVRMISFQKHIEQGFTPEQALVLCQNPSWGYGGSE